MTCLTLRLDYLYISRSSGKLVEIPLQDPRARAEPDAVLPVIEDNHLVGVVYRGRLIRLLASRTGAAGGRHRSEEQAELCRVKAAIEDEKLRYCRIVSVFVRGRWCHEAQFVLDGPAPLRHPVGTESMATIDLGPQWLHVVHDSGSRHIPIAPFPLNAI
jgi:hypothetical protein